MINLCLCLDSWPNVTSSKLDWLLRNIGFNLPWWDRLFGTYRAQPASGHELMIIGLANYRDLKWLTLPWMLIVPFFGSLTNR